jgi:hypothetical protein
MKKLCGAAVLGALLIVPCGNALAAKFKPGSYAGTTDDNKSIAFKVSKKKVSAVSLRFSTVCENPSDAANPLLITLKPTPSLLGVSAPVKKNGRFSFTSDPLYSIGHGMILVNMAGKLHGGKAIGTIRVRFPAESAGFDNYGDCDSGKIGFTAKR